MAAIFWSNVKIDVQSALGAAKAISAVTKANPAVATSTAHGFANGDIVVLPDVAGMVELTGRAFRVAGVTANTFQLEGEDSSGYGTFVSGNAYQVTALQSMSTVQGVNVSGGDPEFADTTTIHDTIRKQAPTIVSPLTMTFDSLFDSADNALKELNKASKTKTTRVVRLTFSSGAAVLANCYVAAPLVPTGAAQQAVTTPITLTSQGIPNAY